MKDWPVVDIYTDGSCLLHTSKKSGGWAAILLCSPHFKLISGMKKETTNNEMELMAIFEGLKALKRESNVRIYSDSILCINVCTMKWMPKKNIELVEAIITEMQRHIVAFIYVPGHKGHRYNEIVDKAAKAMARGKRFSLPERVF